MKIQLVVALRGSLRRDKRDKGKGMLYYYLCTLMHVKCRLPLGYTVGASRLPLGASKGL